MKNVKKIISTALICTIALGFSGCNMLVKTKEGINKSVVATVGSKKITRSDLDSNPDVIYITKMIEEKYGKDISKNTEAKDMLKAQKQQVLQQMIAEQIAMSKVEELKLKPDSKALKEETDKKIEEIKKSVEQNGKKLEDVLKEQGIAQDTFRKDIEKQVVIQKLYDNVTKDVSVDDNKAQQYYSQNQYEFTEKPNRIHTAHILVKTEDEAKKVKERLDKGEDFTAIAKEVSQDPSAKENGGDMGFVPYVGSGFVQEYMVGAMALNEGQISPPVQSQYGFHIIKCIKKEEYPVKDFSKVKDDIKKKLETQEKQNAFRTKMDEWMKNAKIETQKYEKNLV